MILKLIARRMDECRILVGLTIGMYILATIMMAFIMNFSKDEDTSFALASTMLIIIAVFYFLFMGVFGYEIEFNLAIGMGVTRKQFVPAYFVSSVFLLIIQSALIYIGYFIEKWEINTFYNTLPYERSVEGLLFSKYMIFGILFIAVAQVFAGSMAMKFGKKVFWVVWAGLMLFSIIPNKVEKAMEKADGSFFDKLGQQFFKVIGSFNEVTGILLLVVLVAALLGGTYLLQRKQQYTIM